MTYKSEDLRYHDHEHGPECREFGDDRSNPDAFATHIAEFSADLIRQAVLFDQKAFPRARYVIGGPDEVRALMADLQGLRARMDPPAFSAIWKEVASDAAVDSLERDLCQCVTCIDKAQLINRIRADKQIIEAYKQQHTDDLAKLARLPESDGNWGRVS